MEAETMQDTIVVLSGVRHEGGVGLREAGW